MQVAGSAQVPTVAASPEGEVRRHFKGRTATLVTIAAVLMSFYHIAYALHLYDWLGIYMMTQTFVALSAGFILTLGFVILPATKSSPRDRIPWYDFFLIAAAGAGPLYQFLTYEARIQFVGTPDAAELILGILTILAVLELARRAAGWLFVILLLAFIVYPFVSPYLPDGFFHTRAYGVGRIIGTFAQGTEGVYGSVMRQMASEIFAFLLFAAFLRATRAGQLLIDLAFGLMGHTRGGTAKAAVLASGMFGTMSGSTSANVAGIGIVTIPAMKKAGFEPHVAAAIETCASVGGQLVPPVLGAAIFFMIDFLNIGYDTAIITAIIPAFLYYLALYVRVDFHAARHGLAGLPSAELPRLTKTMKEGWFFLLPIGVLVYFLLVLKWNAEVAALAAIASLAIVSALDSLARNELNKVPRMILSGLEGGALSVVGLGAVAIGVGLTVATVSLTGLGLNLSGMLVDLAAGNVAYLVILAAVASIILGLELPTQICYLLLAILIAPSLVRMGVNPLAAHFFIFYMGLSAPLTPPVCVGAFVAANIAGADMFRTGWTACRMAVLIYIVPFIFIWRTGLLMIGTPVDIATAVVPTAIGIIALGAAMEGYFVRRATWAERMVLLAAAVVQLAAPWPTSMLGLAGIGAVGLWQRRRDKLNQPALA